MHRSRHLHSGYNSLINEINCFSWIQCFCSTWDHVHYIHPDPYLLSSDLGSAALSILVYYLKSKRQNMAVGTHWVRFYCSDGIVLNLHPRNGTGPLQMSLLSHFGLKNYPKKWGTDSRAALEFIWARTADDLSDQLYGIERLFSI